jgi:hypothetical protein
VLFHATTTPGKEDSHTNELLTTVCWLVVVKSRRVCCLSFVFRGAPVTLFTRQMHAAVCEFAAVIFIQTKPPVTLSGKMLQSHNLTALLFFFAFESSL